MIVFNRYVQEMSTAYVQAFAAGVVGKLRVGGL